jgi:hypothetical protein
MAASHIFRVAKLKGGGRLLAAARHNRRTIQAERGADSHIIATRSYLNYSLAGAETPEAIDREAKTLMRQAGYQKLRKDAVTVIEIIYSLPLNHEVDSNAFFVDCLSWSSTHFGGIVLSFDVHMDESTPHAHALILPLLNGRMVGSDMVGNRMRLRALTNSFYEHVASRRGLKRPCPKLSGIAKASAERAVLGLLKNDPVMRSLCWPVIRDLVHKDPMPFTELLGVIPTRSTKKRSFVSIMTSKGKGSNPIGFSTN